MDDTQHEPLWGWTDLLLLFGLGIPAFVVAAFAVRWMVLSAGLGDNKGLGLLLPQFAGQGAMLVAFALLVRVKYDRPFLPQLRMGVHPRDAIQSFLAGFSLAAAVLLLAMLLRTPQIPSPMQDLMNDPQALVWVAVFAVSIGPVFEEIFFRGLLQPVAVRTIGVVAGILIGALPFALLHGPQYSWSWRHVVLITVAGAAFGWWRLRSQSTGAAALMHAGYNTVLVVGFLVGRSAL